MAKKTLNCVELKNAIQEKLLKEYQRMNRDEAVRHFGKKLQSSKSPAANFWKQLQEKQILKKTG